MKYRAEIDGLRALAVVPVILFHAKFELFSGGFVGVDVFFVISGYLITTILIEDIENQRFSLVNFYERRARRILPALFFVMLVCIPFAWMWMLPFHMKDFSQSLVAVSLFASNILFWLESGYFDAAAEDKPLLHTWSLAVEEQYYVLFPIFLIFAWRFGKNRVFWMIVVMATISLLLSEWGWRNKASANFYLAPTRAWELFSGSIAAFIVQKKGVQKNNPLAMLGLAAIIFSIFFYDETTPFPSVYALVPVLGVILFVLYADKETLVAKLLSTKVFLGIGLISYSAYLWHQPMFAFAKVKLLGETSELLMFTLAVFSLVLGYFSWRFIESPFRKISGKSTISRYNMFAISLFGLALFFSIGVYGHKNNGFVERFNIPKEVLADFRLPMRWEGFCFYSFNDRDINVGEDGFNCKIGNPNLPSNTLLFGDSYAAHWEPFLKEATNDYEFSFDSVTTNWCFPSLNDDYTAPRGHISIEQCDLNRKWFKENAAHYDNILLSSAWHGVEELGYGEGVYELIESLIDSTDSQIIIIDTPPQFSRITVENSFFNKNVALPLHLNYEANINADNFIRKLQSRFSNNDRVVVVVQSDFGFGSERDYRTITGYPYSLDGGHISVYGARQLYYELSETQIVPPMISQLQLIENNE